MRDWVWDIPASTGPGNTDNKCLGKHGKERPYNLLQDQRSHIECTYKVSGRRSVNVVILFWWVKRVTRLVNICALFQLTTDSGLGLGWPWSLLGAACCVCSCSAACRLRCESALVHVHHDLLHHRHFLRNRMAKITKTPINIHNQYFRNIIFYLTKNIYSVSQRTYKIQYIYVYGSKQDVVKCEQVCYYTSRWLRSRSRSAASSFLDFESEVRSFCIRLNQRTGSLASTRHPQTISCLIVRRKHA